MAIRLKQLKKGRVQLLTPYRKERRKKIKTMIGSWDSDLKALISINDILLSPFNQGIKTGQKKNAFLIDSPGEYEIKDVFVKGIKDSDGSTIYIIEAEQSQTCFLPGVHKKELETYQLDEMEDVNTLILVLDSASLPSSKWVKNIIAQIEPEVVVFSQKSEGDKKEQEAMKDFFKELDIKSIEYQDELELNISDFDEEKRKFFVLSSGK